MKILLFFLLIFILFIFCYARSYFRPYFISKSSIHGYGLFSNKSYKKGDIIINDLFPYNYNRNRLTKLGEATFNKYILKEGKYINHCNSKANSDLITNDNIYFKLIALKDIKKDEEILADDDIIHKKIPFIAKSMEYYKKC